MPTGLHASAERDAQKSYWAEHSVCPTVEAMMLDSKAAEIDQLERPEVMNALGNVEGKKVLELGAGIGRFTGDLAQAASDLTAVDFMATSIEENKRTHGHLPNIQFMVGDVTELQMPAESFDVVFSNWLLMYLADEEVAALAVSMLRWLRVGGCVFFRESCFRQSGDKARKANPTHYRNPRDYFRLFDCAEVVCGDGTIAHFTLEHCRCVDTYVRLKRNHNQVCWRWTKVLSASPRRASFREFLDAEQYSQRSLSRYERVCGAGYVSTGGAALTRGLVTSLSLRPGARVLNVGCGTGGAAFYLASALGVHVHAIDLSVNAVLLAIERAVQQDGGDVTLEVSDASMRDFEPNSFDAIYSRDTLLHVRNKQHLLERFLSWLRPGGQLLLTDYCWGGETPSPSMAAYVRARRYELTSVEKYDAMAHAVGFCDVRVEDRTEQFAGCVEQELRSVSEDAASLATEFGAHEADSMRRVWADKLARAQQREQCWAVLTARKPCSS